MGEYYDVVDGMHRITALHEIWREFGRLQLDDVLIDATIPCIIRKEETPDEVLTAYANTANATNSLYAPMSWMDSCLN